MTQRSSVHLFTLGGEVTGQPTLLSPATFVGLGAKEVQDLERWIKREPQVLGEELLVVASQLASWDKTKDRPDLLALDRNGKLAVIEIKRDTSGSGQDLQALRYAAYASALSADEIVGLFRDYREREHDEPLSPAEARERIEHFVEGDLDDLDDDLKPRMILVAGDYQVGVTSTALWLTSQWGMDITCVRLTPFEIAGEIVLASAVLLPLPEAADYEVKLQQKRQKSAAKKAGRQVDFQAARAFIASIPSGRWASYGDVAAASGSPQAAQSIGTWLSRDGDDVPNVYRVLNRFGEVSDGWKAASPALPSTPEAVRQRLMDEGVAFEGQRAAADHRWTSDDWAAAPASSF